MQVNWWWLSLSCVGLLPTHGLPGSSVHEIFPGKKTGVIAISFSRGSSRPKDHTRVSCIAGGTLPLSHHTGQFSSAAQLCPTLCDSMDCSTPGFPLHHQLLELGQTHVHWVGDAIQPFSSSVIPFSSFLQSFPESGSFAVSQFFASGGQSIGASASASASVFPMNIQDWFPLGLTGLILQSKELSRVFSSTTVQKHRFFGNQLSLWSNSHIHTWLLENT